MTDPLAEGLLSLKQAREDQAQRVAQETARLSQLDEAIARLENTVLVIDPSQVPRRRDFTGLGIIEAAKRWLSEVGEARTTNEIADEILARGVTTKSQRFIPTVYATLANSSDFVRQGDKWKLKEGRK